MLNTNKILGFVPSKDLVRSKGFYVGVLGMEFGREDSFALELRGGGNRVRISKVESFEPMPFTILGWEVSEIESIAEKLKQNGVKFEVFPGLRQSSLGIWDSPSGAKVAWFKDPDGNLLSISQHRDT